MWALTGPSRGGGSWSRDDVILFAPTYASSLYRVPATGGVPVPVTTLDPSQQETGHLWPSFLPDGRHFLYLVRSAKPDHAGIFVGSIDSKESRRLISADSPAVYAPEGYLIFLAGTNLMAQPFDADRLELTGVPLRIAEQVFYSSAIGGYGAFSVSRNTLVYRSGSVSGNQLTWFDRTGKQLDQPGAQANYTVASLSPDERKVATAVISDTGTIDIWMLDLVRNTSSRLTFDGTSVIPIWSPDGSRILYRSGQTGPGDLYQRLSSGAGAEEILLKSNAIKNPTDWSSDGRFVIYDNQGDSKTGVEIWVLPMTGDRPSTRSASSGSTVSGVEPSTSSGRPEPAEGRKPFPLLQTQFNEQQGRLSPDGRWIAYTSDETRNPELYVQSFPAPGGKWQISTSGGADPRWRHDGKELFFISNDRKLMGVEVKAADSTFQAGLPQELFATRVSGLTDVRTHYAVTADGKRFLVSSLSEDDGSSPMTVVLNWTAGLKK